MVGRDLVRVTLVSTACARAEVWQAFAFTAQGSSAALEAVGWPC
jgi:hypothetical protein